MEFGKRKKILAGIKRVILDNEGAIMKAMALDMGKPLLEAYSSEIVPTLSEIDFICKHLRRWMRPRKVATPKAFFPAKSWVTPTPKGRILIIGAWNYPFQLCLIPALGAIAAGNQVVIKPSELAPHSSAIIRRLFGENREFDEVLKVVEGGADETGELLGQQFDHIFYTGGERVGKIVMKAAAEQLIPVTLELGGKSPAVVLDHPAQSARRLAWGKFFNGGQTCVAPDYILIDKKIRAQFEREFIRCLQLHYGANSLESPDLARIVNERHYQRLCQLISRSKVLWGGNGDEQKLKIEPTLVEASPVNMDQEIFGPILPFVTIESVQEAIDFIAARANPLALYIFSSDKKLQKKILQQTNSGGVCINDTLIHLSNSALPFGGIGASGMGQYHGYYSFETFSHKRAVMRRSLLFDIPLRYPPYVNKLSSMRFFRRLKLF